MIKRNNQNQTVRKSHHKKVVVSQRKSYMRVESKLKEGLPSIKMKKDFLLCEKALKLEGVRNGYH